MQIGPPNAVEGFGKDDGQDGGADAGNGPRVLLPSSARSIARGAFATGLSQPSSRPRPSDASRACPPDRRKTIAGRSLAETMWIFAYSAARLADALWPLVFRAPVPSRPKHFGKAHHLQPFSITYGNALMKMMFGIRTFPH